MHFFLNYWNDSFLMNCLLLLNVGSQIAAHDSNGMTPGPTFFTLDFGVWQGSVLSPFLFALYLDNLSNLMSSKTGVYIVKRWWDITNGPSVDVADQLLKSVERELINLYMVINAKKSCCLRIGPRCNVLTSPIALYLLHLESKFHRRIKYGILVPLLSNVVNLNVV